MGVVRDITIEQLTQAVGGIDTSTLAQDSTLQAVVTAINNISGGSDPVTNTTVNTLGKDTTLQSISAAISALSTSVKPDASDIPYDSNLSVKGKIDKMSDDIGSFWSIDWTATSSNAINIILTAQATLNKGVYIAIGNAPTLSVNNYIVAIRASKTINAKTVYNTINTLSGLVFTFEVLSDDTNVYISSASSALVTFSNLSNGGLRIVKLK